MPDPNLAQQVEFNQARVDLYTSGRRTIGAVRSAVEGEAVNYQTFEQHFEAEANRPASFFAVDDGSTQNKVDTWGVLHSSIAQAEQHDLFTKKFTLRGVEYERANVAVGMGGQVFNAVIERPVGSPNDFEVQLAKFTTGVDASGRTIAMLEAENPAFQDPISVHREGEKLTVDMTRSISAEDRAAMFGDPDYKLQVEEGLFTPYNHQQDAIVNVAHAGAQNALVTAGTGTGKTAILAGYAKATGGGIVAVPQSLVSQAVDDTKGFLGSSPVKLDNTLLNDPATLSQFFKDNPHVVLSHDQLLASGEVLKGYNILIDEAHELTQNADGTPNVDKTAALKDVTSNNITTAVTATPSAELLEMHGNKVTADISLHYAQNELRAVRRVDSQDRFVGQAGADNTNAMVHEALVQSMGRDSYLASRDNGFTSPDMLREKNPGLSQDAAVRQALAKNRVRGANVQGMMFADNPELANRLHTAMEQVREGTYPQMDQLNHEVASMRRQSELQALEGLGADAAQMERARGAAAPDVNLSQELKQSHQAILASEINQKAIMEVRDIKGNKVRAAARAGLDLGTMLEDVTLPDKNATMAKLDAAVSNAPNELRPFMEAKRSVVAEMYTAQENGRPVSDALLRSRDIDLKKLGAHGAVTTHAAETAGQIEIKKQMLDLGITQRMVSDGPLGTGYSNPDVMNTVSVISQTPGVGHAQTMSQQLGRPIRDKDRIAQGAVVADANVPRETVFTSEKIYSAESSKHYADAVIAEQTRSHAGRGTGAAHDIAETRRTTPPNPHETTSRNPGTGEQRTTVHNTADTHHATHTTGDSFGTRFRNAMPAAGDGVGVAMGGYNLYNKFSGRDAGFSADLEAGGTRRNMAIGSATADGADVVLSGASATQQIRNGSMLSGVGDKLAGAVDDVANATDDVARAAGSTGGAARLAGRAAIPLAVVSGAFQTGAAFQAQDGHRAARSIGGTVGGILGGVAAGAGAGAVAGSVVPGAGTVVVGVVGGVAGGIVGAIAGEEAVDRLIGDRMDTLLNGGTKEYYASIDAAEKALVEKQLNKIATGTDEQAAHVMRLMERKQQMDVLAKGGTAEEADQAVAAFHTQLVQMRQETQTAMAAQAGPDSWMDQAMPSHEPTVSPEQAAALAQQHMATEVAEARGESSPSGTAPATRPNGQGQSRPTQTR